MSVSAVWKIPPSLNSACYGGGLGPVKGYYYCGGDGIGLDLGPFDVNEMLDTSGAAETVTVDVKESIAKKAVEWFNATPVGWSAGSTTLKHRTCTYRYHDGDLIDEYYVYGAGVMRCRK